MMLTRGTRAAPAVLSVLVAVLAALCAALRIGPASAQTIPPQPPPAIAPAPPPPAEPANQFSSNELIDAGHRFFGGVSRGLAMIVEKAVSRWGQPNGYILGEEASGAF